MANKERTSEAGARKELTYHKEFTVFSRLDNPLQRLRDFINLQKFGKGGILGTEGLQWLVDRYNLLDPKPEKIDGQSIDLHLGNLFARYRDGATLRYRGEDQDDPLIQFEIPDGDVLRLGPQKAVLGITKQIITIPKRFFGFIQTKGGLARGLTSVELDMQFYEGFAGVGVLQIINHHPTESGVHIEIPIGAPIAALHVLPVRGNSIPYNGRYQGQNHPTPL